MNSRRVRRAMIRIPAFLSCAHTGRKNFATAAYDHRVSDGFRSRQAVGYQSAVTRSSASGPAAANRRLNRQQRPARFGQGVDATGIVPDAIVDVVGVLLLV